MVSMVQEEGSQVAFHMATSCLGIGWLTHKSYSRHIDKSGTCPQTFDWTPEMDRSHKKNATAHQAHKIATSEVSQECIKAGNWVHIYARQACRLGHDCQPKPAMGHSAWQWVCCKLNNLH